MLFVVWQVSYPWRVVTIDPEEMAEAEHTALLLKCYTKLKDFATLEDGWMHGRMEGFDFFLG